MANKEQRGNREKRKPNKDKPKVSPHVSIGRNHQEFSRQEGRWVGLRAGGI
jgi:hypothetical protein